ncbi:MAG: porin family protein [Bergeyella sp.]
MAKTFFKILIFSALGISTLSNAQLFRTKDRMENREGMDDLKFSYGFYLAGNNFDYKLVLDPKYGMENQKNLVQVKSSYSFGAGLIGKMRLNENFDLRLEPGLQFVQRDITFNTDENTEEAFFSETPDFSEADRNRTVKSTYVDIPLLLEFHGDRWYNSRPYAAAGVNWMLNLQSNNKSLDDNQQGIFRTTSSNFAWSAEIGMQFYFSRFKLTPAFRGTFMINNEMVADNPGTPPYWAGAISTAKTRALMFVLKFE